MPKWDNFKWKKPINTPWHRSTEAEVIERITQITKLLIQSYPRYEIIAIFQTKYWLSESQIDDYIARAKKRIKEKKDEEIWEMIDVVNARIDDMHQWARKEKKRADVGRAIKLKMELYWLEAPKKIQIWQITEEDKAKVDALLDANV